MTSHRSRYQMVFDILVDLKNRGSQFQTDLRLHTNLSPGIFLKLLTEMENRCLIERTNGKALMSDHMVYTWIITEAGRAVCEDLVDMLDKYNWIDNI